METTYNSARQAHSPTPRPRNRLVTDAPTRMFHWLFALCFVGAYITSESERLRALHVTLGYTLAGLLVFRLFYGLLGPRQARLSVISNKISTSMMWLRQLPKAVMRGKVNWQPAHNLVMAFAIASMWLLVLPLTLSGYAIFNDQGGEWLEELHELAGNTFLMLVLFHLGLLLAWSIVKRKNLTLPMLTGHTQGKGPDLIKYRHRWLAFLILMSTMAYWRWEWQQSPNGLISRQALIQTLSDSGDD